jgi:hypothetical protein
MPSQVREHQRDHPTGQDDLFIIGGEGLPLPYHRWDTLIIIICMAKVYLDFSRDRED